MERELKFTVHGELPDLTKLRELAGHPLVPAGLERQRNTYFDTRDLALARSRHSLRVRRVEADGHEPRAVVTLKGPSVVQDAAFSREELEAPLPDPEAGPESVGGEIASRVGALTGGAALKPVARLEARRRLFSVAGAELAVDEVKVFRPHDRAGAGPVLEFGEVEVEAKAGAVPLEALGAALRAIAPLAPSLTGKIGRAMAAIGGTDRAGRDTPWALAAAGTVAAELERLGAYLPMARAGLDPEGVHGARVATRRLRAALAIFGEAVPPADEDLVSELRWVAGPLGGVRDLDVLIGALPRWADRLGVQPARLEPALDLLRQDREAAREAMLVALDTPRLADLVSRLERLAATGMPGLAAYPSGGRPVGEAGPVAVRLFMKRLERRGRAALEPGAPPEALHDLRKAAKRARYGLEFLAPAFGKPVEETTEHLKAAQAALGEINDAWVAVERLEALADRLADAPAAFALGRLSEGLERRADEARGAFAGTWKAFSPRSERHRLLRAIGYEG